MNIFDKMINDFFTPKQVLIEREAMTQLDKDLHQVTIESNISSLQSSIGALELRERERTARLMQTLTSLFKLNIDGEHTLYVGGKPLTLVFKGGALVTIKESKNN